MLIFLIIYIVCGVLAYGVTLGYFLNEYPGICYWSTIFIAIFYGLLGFFGLFISIMCSDFVKHGLKFK